MARDAPCGSADNQAARAADDGMAKQAAAYCASNASGRLVKAQATAVAVSGIVVMMPAVVRFGGV